MFYIVLLRLFHRPNPNRSALRCDPWTIGLSVLAILLLMVRCDG